MVGTASGQAPRQLVIFLHGVGSDGDDLIALAPYFAHILPDAEFLSPHAPFPFDMAPMGRQWFSLASLTPSAILDGARIAAPLLNAYIDSHLAARGLDDRHLALVGFSQGTMMALHVALRRPAAIAALVGYSGLLPAPDSLPAELTARPPVLLVHGEADDVVPFAFLDLAAQALTLVHVPVTTLSRPGLGHTIDDEGLMQGIDFVAAGFGIGTRIASSGKKR
jgi:phospholipase/carboxylesterase